MALKLQIKNTVSENQTRRDPETIQFKFIVRMRPQNRCLIPEGRQSFFIHQPFSTVPQGLTLPPPFKDTKSTPEEPEVQQLLSMGHTKPVTHTRQREALRDVTRQEAWTGLARQFHRTTGFTTQTGNVGADGRDTV